jgi:hypothetical protein
MFRRQIAAVRVRMLLFDRAGAPAAASLPELVKRRTKTHKDTDNFFVT